MAEKVSCARCRYFVADTIGCGAGIGSCKVYSHYEAKGMSQRELDNLFKNVLGDKLFWRGTDLDKADRDCQKHISINEGINES